MDNMLKSNTTIHEHDNSSKISNILRLTTKLTPKFKLYGEYIAFVIDVYDGDTFHCTFCPFTKFNCFDPYLITIRTLGYDAPEMKPSKDKPNRDLEIQCAKIATNKLKNLILNKIIKINIANTEDKYGRYLSYVYVDDDNGSEINVNLLMITHGYGIPYEGKTKETFDFSNYPSV
jgi:endonuclease YncB( thermonuclease family)